MSTGIRVSACALTPIPLFTCGNGGVDSNTCPRANFSLDPSVTTVMLRDNELSSLGLSPSTKSSPSPPSDSGVSAGNISALVDLQAQLSQQKADDDKKLVAVGAGMGVPLGLALVVTLVLLFLEKRKNGRLRREWEQVPRGPEARDLSAWSTGLGNGAPAAFPYAARVHVLEKPAPTAELPGIVKPHELQEGRDVKVEKELN